ncbi:JAB domain-containing protein [Prosthecobacter sp.]|uniref:JAB domain-containing protein n=1 Tax=Prosthecobacter sp. TaxID=1965333 RepID=UPI002AB9C0C9|nr:JAB domain-containing protein [Prosthecobacter sp.]MDZ4403074.1 JAB domain-containing protein [Prosthecobacter sp.]
MPSVKLPMLGHFQIAKVSECPPVAVPDKPASYAAYWRDVIAPSPFIHADKEHVVVVALDIKLNAKGWHLVSMGDLNGAYCGPREVMRPLIICAAYSFILMHNHPSGCVTPSDTDRRLTRRVREAGETMGVELMDHIIVGDGTGEYFSFREHGLIGGAVTVSVKLKHRISNKEKVKG